MLHPPHSAMDHLFNPFPFTQPRSILGTLSQLQPPPPDLLSPPDYVTGLPAAKRDYITPSLHSHPTCFRHALAGLKRCQPPTAWLGQDGLLHQFQGGSCGPDIYLWRWELVHFLQCWVQLKYDGLQLQICVVCIVVAHLR